MSVLRLFPDTNVFLQCRDLSELDWDQWSEFDEIHLVVCHVVQREIDRRKTGQNERTTRRARKTASRFRQVVLGDSDDHIVRERAPQVLLVVDSHYSHSPHLELDYTINDNQLVGTVHAASEANPHDDTRLLTHDTFPLATARRLGLKAEVVPEHWLLPPEPTKHEKRIRELRTELEILRAQEPSCTIECLDWNNNDIATLSGDHQHFPHLRNTEVDQLLRNIETAIPLATDFGMATSQRRTLEGPRHLAFALQEQYVPAKEEDIDGYRKKYSHWLSGCRELLKNYHFHRQGTARPHRFLLRISNVGSRPANDALLTLAAHGTFQLAVHGDSTPAVTRTSFEDELLRHLKASPTPPHGKWLPIHALGLHSPFFRALSRLHATDVFPEVPAVMDRLHIPGLLSEPRDANEFHFAEGEPGVPQRQVRLECDQWRHGGACVPFVVDIREIGESGANGVVAFQIEAANLSESVKKQIRIEIVTTRMNTFHLAERDLNAALRQTRGPEHSKDEGC